MTQELKVCEVDPELKALLKKFRFRKEQNNAAIVMRIEKSTMLVCLDEELEDCDIDEVRESLPEHQPRYLVYSFKQEHSDGRISFPMCFVYVSPEGCQPELSMMYAGSKTALVVETGMTKVFELRTLEDLTDSWLVAKLQKLY
ncbi:glia maturation factor gamma-like [Watersipora subatra]|uniref:glia maturation factor gamma-like n=1 Tax=Watersipora subatra TaxID=2589382 RepID=UPI00355AF3EF